MSIALHETCQQYVSRRLSEGWEIVWQRGVHLILSSPDGNILRPVDLRNDVETLRPNAAGDETSIPSQFPVTGSHYDKVDEVIADNNSTYVYNHEKNYGVWYRDLYNLPASSGSGTINGIKVYFRCLLGSGAGGQSCSARAAIKSNSTVTDGPIVTRYIGAWETWSQEWTTNPADSQPWEWADIDALQIGVGLRQNGNYSCKCTQVYVEVDYTVGVAYEKTLTESLGLVDKVVKAPSLVKTEPLGLVDSYSRTWAIYRVYPEILGLSDTVVKAPSLVKTESLGLVDSVAAVRVLVKVLTELLGLSDVVVKDVSKVLADNVGLVDTLTKGVSLPLSETLGLLDSILKSLSITRIESLGLEDHVSKHISLHALTEVLGLLDSISYSKNPTILAKLIRKLIQLEDIGGGVED